MVAAAADRGRDFFRAAAVPAQGDAGRANSG